MIDFSNPYTLLVQIVLSVISSWYLWRGFRDKNSADLLLGIGSGIPSFAPASWQAWVAGIAVWAVGRSLKRSLG